MPNQETLNPQQQENFKYWEPYACRLIPKEDQSLFTEIQKIFKKLPSDIDLGHKENGDQILLSCHILARAVSNSFPLKLCDGSFSHKGYYHSWLETDKSIIDIYPIGVIGGPILIDKISPLSRFYLKHKLPKDITETDLFLSNVKKTTEIIKDLSQKI